MAELNRVTAGEAAARIARGEITSEALVADCLARIGARETLVHAWAFLDPELALAEARKRDKERARGVLHGVPVGIKDVIDTGDMPTEYGSSLYRGHRGTTDAATVAALRRAGAVILGKTRTTEFACPYPTETRNPHDLDRTPGVSSSGSAASVADFHVPLSNGTQTGGSVIRPAALCGLYGYKASLDGLDRAGIRHLKPSIDTLGLFARSLDDIALMRAALTGEPAALDEIGQAPRIGVCRGALWSSVAPETEAMFEAIERSLRGEGAAVTEVAFPDDYDEVIAAHRTVTGYESKLIHGEELAGKLDNVNPWTRTRMQDAESVTEADFDRARETGARARRGLAALFQDFDALIAPAAEGEAPKDLRGIEGGSHCSLWTFMYVPCVTVPAFTGPHAMPLGPQIIGPQGADSRTLAVARWIEGALARATGGLPAALAA